MKKYITQILESYEQYSWTPGISEKDDWQFALLLHPGDILQIFFFSESWTFQSPSGVLVTFASGLPSLLLHYSTQHYSSFAVH